MEKKNKKIAIIGGQLSPALAVLDKLLDDGYENIIWIGQKYPMRAEKNTSAEYQQVKARKVRFVRFHMGKIWRNWGIQNLFSGLINFILVPFGFLHAFYVTFKEKPDLILSFGGNIALPIVIIAHLLKVKTVTHEQTIAPRRANILVATYSDKILVGWKQSLKFFSKQKAVLTGNPIRKEILKTSTNSYRFDNDLPIIYISAGSEGAHAINWRTLKIVPKLLAKANIIHQTSNSSITNDYEKALEFKRGLPEEVVARYIVRDNIYSAEIGEILSKADLLVSRSGASSINEILYLGKRSILIPYPWSAHNEQLNNAKFVSATGLAKVLKQNKKLSPTDLYKEIDSALDLIQTDKDFNGNILSETVSKTSNLIEIDATEKIAEEVKKLL